MKLLHGVVMGAFCLGASASLAQEPTKAPAQPLPALPTKLTGAIDLMTSDARQFTDGLEVQITSQEAGGRIGALFTRHVRYQNPNFQCIRARDVPADGTYDGKKLVLTVRLSQSLAICSDVIYTFFRGTKEHYFFTKGKDGSWSMYLDPIQ
jgi:hypothetical protein